MNNTHRRFAILFFLSSFILHPSSFPLLAQPPALINYQGRLVDGTNLVNGTVGLSLRLFNVASGGAALYEDSNTVTVSDGLYATFIGDHPTNNAFVTALTNQAVWIEVAVNGTALTPRERLVAVSYSLSTRGMMASTNGIIVLNPTLGANSVNAGSSNSTVAGGRANIIASTSHYSVISGGRFNSVGSGSPYAVVGGGDQNVLGGNSEYALINGGNLNTIGADADGSVIGGGQDNRVVASSKFVTIAGGRGQEIGSNSLSSTISGGDDHAISGNSWYVSIAGGEANRVGTNAWYSSVGGGANNRIMANSWYAIIDGGSYNGIGSNAGLSVVGGGWSNNISDGCSSATIAGGRLNRIGSNADSSVIGGGWSNRISADSESAVIAGGDSNNIWTNARYATIGGGFENNVFNESYSSLIAGGARNYIGINARYSVIMGGLYNSISNNSEYAIILGGVDNEVGAGATNALAGGRKAKAHHRGAFVWGDNTDSDVSSTNMNSVTMRAAGGYRMFTDTNLSLGAELAPNATAWSTLSDRSAKENFAPIDTARILDEVARLPLTEWTYKHDPERRRYIGPVAQDFHAAFGLGNDTTITTIDADGISLAAIQGLVSEVRGQKSVVSDQLAELEAENARLRERLEALERKLGM